uniref:Uncharacterized protein n=1 Tax=Arundo donax TaxID=35708 RepID=A0A0A9G1F5_ARUDO
MFCHLAVALTGLVKSPFCLVLEYFSG